MVRDWDPDWQLVQPLDPARTAASTSHVDMDQFQARIDAVIKENLKGASQRAEAGSASTGRTPRSPAKRASARRTSAAKRARRSTG